MSPRAFAIPRAILFFALMAGAARGQVVISEFMASNINTLIVDEDGNHEDWIELRNTGAAAVSLNGWYLTDNSGDLRKWQFPPSTPAVSLAPGARLLVWASNKNRKAAAARLHTNFKLDPDGEFLALVRPDGLTVEHGYSPTYPKQATDISYGIPEGASTILYIEAGLAGKAKTAISAADFTANFGGWNSSPAFNDTAWQPGANGFGYERDVGYGSYIGAGGNVDALMYGVIPSCFVRFKFNIANPAQVQALTLRMKYDDGFIAYLNGQKVAAFYDPASPQWDSAATGNRPDALNDSWESYDLTAYLGSLVTGDNVLAFQGLNASTVSSDFLVLTELEASVNLSVGGTPPPSYLTSATPGVVNTGIKSNVGPFISQVTKDPVRPTGTAASPPLVVTAKVVASLRPLAAANPVQLAHRTMYGAETLVTMLDNGFAPDALAGDAIFTAQISTAALAPGQMLRWRVIASDNLAISSTGPPYIDPQDSEQYFGTVATDSSIETALPVLWWFTNDAAATRTFGGARCSFFYNGQFYDNVQTDLHGQSTSGFPVDKKSHDINFNQDNRFEWNATKPKLKALNLLSNYADKAKVRTTLAYESFRDSGGYYHFAFPVRVQQVRPDNEATPAQHFWGVYDFVENGDEKWLERLGLDPNGALYKVYDQILDPNNSEKKTRAYEDRSDLQAFIDALNEALPQTDRRRWGYDNVDIPSVINTVAVLAISGDVDQGHKNFYLYRDSNNTREWSLMPWDVDLSFGHDWTCTGVGPNASLCYHYFDDNIYATDALHLGADNKLKTLIWNSNELNAMFVRRMRSIMDKLLQTSATPLAQRYYESRIDALMNAIDPPAIGASDADLDFAKWSGWTFPATSGGPPTVDGGAGQKMRAQADRIKNSFLPARRGYLAASGGSSPGAGGTLFIPAAQPAVPVNVFIQSIDFNPTSGNQEQEFFIVRNANIYALDISGWKITGAVNFTFRAGTVIPAVSTATSDGASTANVNQLVVTKNPAQWRLRTASPKAQELRYITGGFGNHLSARGETINLVIPGATPAQDVIVATNTYVGTATAGQSFLRITELNIKPAPPTAAELLALPGVTASDFEFVELINTGASPLALGNASFAKGVEFTYNPEWYGVPDATELDGIGGPTGYTLVTRATAPAYDSYGIATTWALGSVAGGTPGTGDTVFSHTFIGWRQDYFTAAEQLNAAISDPAADPDGDGRSNFREFVFGGNPRIADQEPRPLASRVNVSGTDYAAITFSRQRNAIDTAYTVQVSSDLVTWTTAPDIVGAPTNLGNGTERVTFRDPLPLGAAKRFLRVSAAR